MVAHDAMTELGGCEVLCSRLSVWPASVLSVGSDALPGRGPAPLNAPTSLIKLLSQSARLACWTRTGRPAEAGMTDGSSTKPHAVMVAACAGGGGPGLAQHDGAVGKSVECGLRIFDDIADAGGPIAVPANEAGGVS